MKMIPPLPFVPRRPSSPSTRCRHHPSPPSSPSSPAHPPSLPLCSILPQKGKTLVHFKGTAFYHGTKARNGMFEMLDTIIARRRNGSDMQQDFLGSLIIKHVKEGSEGEDDDEKLTDAQMKDNVLTQRITGHDTTTPPLHVENQATLDQLKEEHMEIWSKRKSGSTLTWSEVNNMPYTEKVEPKCIVINKSKVGIMVKS
ncbi:unnamed protein product [Lactuca saligna]|uniref:Uncharacterized protein n=1 Tax=Lactuca saligna TaxID=75948 RepID=A0AA35ZQV5_LACSI|nr:unnamed protein product [Lactuca saligna]